MQHSPADLNQAATQRGRNDCNDRLVVISEDVLPSLKLT